MTDQVNHRAVGYIRVSTEDQTEGHSLPAQRREIERYCEQHGLRLVGMYADEGVSAYTDVVEKRPQLSALLADAHRHLFDVVVVHTIDRWARNARVHFESLARLGTARVGFASVSENVDYSTPHGKLMLTMLGGFSEFFSGQLGVHVLKSQRQRAEAGIPVGPVPFGYVVDESTVVPRAEPREANSVRAAFAARASGQSNAVIADALNREGLRTRTGRLFTAHAIKDMLNCRFYLGIVSFHGEEFPGQHEAVVPAELFERAQARRTRRAASPRSSGKPRGVLTGLIHCARCGNRLHSDRNRAGTPMYRERHGWSCRTNRRAFVAPPVDDQIGKVFRSIELRVDWRDAIAHAAAHDDVPSLDRLLAQKRRLARAYADGGFTRAEYETRMTALDAEIQLTERATPVEVHEVAALLDDLPALWEEATPDERRALLAPLLERVFVEVESRRIAAIAPQPAFRTLLGAAMRRTAECSAVLLAPDEAPAAGAYGLGGDGGELNSPSSKRSSRICYGCSQRKVSPARLR